MDAQGPHNMGAPPDLLPPPSPLLQERHHPGQGRLCRGPDDRGPHEVHGARRHHHRRRQRVVSRHGMHGMVHTRMHGSPARLHPACSMHMGMHSTPPLHIIYFLDFLLSQTESYMPSTHMTQTHALHSQDPPGLTSLTRPTWVNITQKTHLGQHQSTVHSPSHHPHSGRCR